MLQVLLVGMIVDVILLLQMVSPGAITSTQAVIMHLIVVLRVQILYVLATCHLLVSRRRGSSVRGRVLVTVLKIAAPLGQVMTRKESSCHLFVAVL